MRHHTLAERKGNGNEDHPKSKITARVKEEKAKCTARVNSNTARVRMTLIQQSRLCGAMYFAPRKMA